MFLFLAGCLALGYAGWGIAGAVHLGPPAEEREQRNSQNSQLRGFFPSGLGNLLQLSEADAGPCDSPWCEVAHDAPKHKPHPQTSPGAVPALEGALGSPLPTLQAEPMFPGWVLCVSRRSVPRLGSPKAQSPKSQRFSFPMLHQTWRCLSTGNHNFFWAAIPW